ncbi:hypothetical protein DMENIID0001_166630 [Sergentomyia squamirostris]
MLRPHFKNSKSDFIKSHMDIQLTVNEKQKFLIVSEWNSYLGVLKKHLEHWGLTVFFPGVGSYSITKQERLISEFNDIKDQAAVLLMTLDSECRGPNVVEANHIYIRRFDLGYWGTGDNLPGFQKLWKEHRDLVMEALSSFPFSELKDPSVQELIKFIFDKNAIKKVFWELHELDIDEMDLENFDVGSAYNDLTKVSNSIPDEMGVTGGTSGNRLPQEVQNYSTKFSMLIPKIPNSTQNLTTIKGIKKEMDKLESLSGILTVYSMLNGLKAG